MRYLWIDTFCIVQDDTEDWEQESKKMSGIYQNAYFNIAAATAINSHTGIFPPRSVVTSMKLPCVPGSLEDGFLYLTDQKDSDFDFDVEGAKLNSRGWVLQERLLSRRIVHIGTQQVFFECNHRVVAEDGNRVKMNTLSAIMRTIRPCTSVAENERLSYRNEVEVVWKQIMRKYSTCHLTCSSDKIPAILGLANAIQAQTGLRFHHGHLFDRTEKLPTSLLWSTSGRIGDADSELPRGPSWGCTTSNGILTFHKTYADLQCSLVKDPYLRPREVHWEYPDPSIHPDVTRHSFLRIRGRLRTAFLDKYHILHYFVQGLQYNLGGYQMDSPSNHPLTFECLFMYHHKNVLADDRNMLLLEKMPGDDVIPKYRRIGIGTVITDSWFANKPETIFDLI